MGHETRLRLELEIASLLVRVVAVLQRGLDIHWGRGASSVPAVRHPLRSR
jgi:hypothetical protein